MDIGHVMNPAVEYDVDVSTDEECDAAALEAHSQCRACGMWGDFARNCPMKGKGGGKAKGSSTAVAVKVAV